MTTPTPGPWLYRPNPKTDDWGRVRAALPDIGDGAGWTVAYAHAGRPVSEAELQECRERGIDPFEDNGRLIAAAQDLLEQGERFLLATETVLDWMNESQLLAEHEAANPVSFRRLSAAMIAFREAIAKAKGGSD